MQVVRLVGVCTREDPFWIVTEFLEHGNLRAHLHNYSNTTSLQQCLRYILDITEGLEFVHSKGGYPGRFPVTQACRHYSS